MIVYRSIKKQFQEHVDSGHIDQIILKNFKEKLNRKTSEKEVESWWNSLTFMSRVISDNKIPDNTGISIECQIPQTSKRIDFLISGKDEFDTNQVIIVELKQWTKAELSEKHGIVRTALGKGLHETSHPSYQAWSYAAMLEDFCEPVREYEVSLTPCAYLHNYEEDGVIRNEFYNDYLEKAPVFLKREMLDLREFIKKHVKKGDDGEIMYQIDNGRIKPSKQLADSLSNMLVGNREFILIDEQKLIYETGLLLSKESEKGNRNTLIVEGGPGTGKSVVAINLLVELTKQGQFVQYVSKNAAPRKVFEAKLTGSMTPTRFNALFKGSGSYVDSLPKQFDALIVDEAHRLNEKSGLYSNLGENQIKEIINASKLSIFFIDEDQQVTLKDIGTKSEIKKWAENHQSNVFEYELPSQFRCNGSDGYLSFLDNLLQIRETANTNLSGLDYDFRIVDSPNELRELIQEKNKTDNKSRLVAGYCWDWVSKKNPNQMDIQFPEFDFAMKWNLSEDGSAWIIKPESINQIGCIHTCQGLEASYIGVIIGPDLIVRDTTVLVDPSKRSRMDNSIKGYKKLLQEDPELAKNRIKKIIKNTYRTLMTRGMKGCFVYCVDSETRDYFRSFSSQCPPYPSAGMRQLFRRRVLRNHFQKLEKLQVWW
jgi:DUF2075 family protein